MISPTTQIPFQPGDVIGYFTDRESSSIDPNGEGVLLDTSFANESVWYRTISSGSPLVVGPSSCFYSVGSHGHLDSLTRAGPVISASISK